MRNVKLCFSQCLYIALSSLKIQKYCMKDITPFSLKISGETETCVGFSIIYTVELGVFRIPEGGRALSRS